MRAGLVHLQQTGWPREAFFEMEALQTGYFQPVLLSGGEYVCFVKRVLAEAEKGGRCWRGSKKRLPAIP